MSDNNSKNSSRRKFLKHIALGVASFVIVPRHVLGGKGFVAPSDKLLLACVGVGGKGESDIASFYKSGSAEIAYLCDVDDARAATTIKNFPKAKYVKDWRELLSKYSKNFDAVSISTPDHNHANVALAAMQLRKHVYIQKPLAHDIYEVRLLEEAVKKYKVVAQMGNQGASADGVRDLREWYDAGLIGNVHTIYSWTNKPVWPQGIPWPSKKATIPSTLDWDLWLGTAPYTDYVEKLVPFNWRGWWDYGTGALGDMGCHLLEAPFKVLNLQYPDSVECSLVNVYTDIIKRGYYPESCPSGSFVTFTFPQTNKTKGPIKYHWMDGGLQPDRPDEIGPDERYGNGSGTLFLGTKGKMIVDSHGANASLLPYSRMKEVNVSKTLSRVVGSTEGHYAQWVEACIAGYGKKELSAPFDISGPLTETLLIAGLAIRGYELRKPEVNKVRLPNTPPSDGFEYGGRKKLLWDNNNMKITNFDEVNQFVKRVNRKGWELVL